MIGPGDQDQSTNDPVSDLGNPDQVLSNVLVAAGSHIGQIVDAGGMGCIGLLQAFAQSHRILGKRPSNCPLFPVSHSVTTTPPEDRFI